jgi:sortase A
MKLAKQIIFWALVVVVLLIFSNFSYVWKNLAFQFHRPTPTPEPVATVQTQKDTPNWLWIQSLNISAPVIEPAGKTEDDFQVALRSGTVHYPGTAYPGQKGNVYIFGHSSDFAFTPGNFKTVFALLPRIEIGAQIKLTDEEGIIYYYKVTDKFVVDANRTDVLDQDTSKSILTLQTSYPIGTALRRYIVIAELQTSN